MTTRALPPWRRLHLRVAALGLAVLAVLGLASSWIAAQQARDAAREALQRQSLGLAASIASHLETPLVRPDGTLDAAPVRALASHVMMLNPSAEVYLLDAEGRVAAHALMPDALAEGDPTGRAVDLGPLRELDAARHAAGGLPPMAAVVDDDPRHPGRQALFSASSLPGPAGRTPWLYVVLRSPEDASIASSASLRAGAWSLGLATLAAMGVLAIALRRLGRPLARLAASAQAYRPDEETPEGAPAPRDEIDLLATEFERLRRRVDRQIAELHEADRQRRELVGNLSHDLRTPLSALQGYVETALISGDRLPAEARAEHLRTALRHAERLGRRVAALFELSTLDAGRMRPNLEVFCLAELLQDVVAGYGAEAARAGVRLTMDGGRHLGTEVRADIALIERVLQNLIDNALHHTPRGGRVTLALGGEGSTVEVCVADTGRGIAPEHLPFIFERYWRAPAEDADAGAGTPMPAQAGGLGLAIVQRIVELHGSRVRVESTPAHGSAFRFALPQAAA